MAKLRLNTTQLSVLRASKFKIECDRSTGKALVARRFAVETEAGFFLNAAGRERRKKKADCIGKRESQAAPDPALLKDLE